MFGLVENIVVSGVGYVQGVAALSPRAEHRSNRTCRDHRGVCDRGRAAFGRPCQPRRGVRPDRLRQPFERSHGPASTSSRDPERALCCASLHGDSRARPRSSDLDRSSIRAFSLRHLQGPPIAGAIAPRRGTRAHGGKHADRQTTFHCRSRRRAAPPRPPRRAAAHRVRVRSSVSARGRCVFAGCPWRPGIACSIAAR